MRQIKRTLGASVIFYILQECIHVSTYPLPQWDPYHMYLPGPGGRGVSHLSHMTQELGDDMSERITAKSHLVSRVGHMIQDMTDYNSQLAEFLGHVVDGNDPAGPYYHYSHHVSPNWTDDTDEDDADVEDDEENDTDEHETV